MKDSSSWTDNAARVRSGIPHPQVKDNRKTHVSTHATGDPPSPNRKSKMSKCIELLDLNSSDGSFDDDLSQSSSSPSSDSDDASISSSSIHTSSIHSLGHSVPTTIKDMQKTGDKVLWNWIKPNNTSNVPKRRLGKLRRPNSPTFLSDTWWKRRIT